MNNHQKRRLEGGIIKSKESSGPVPRRPWRAPVSEIHEALL
jgi:hypothetical protein